MSNTITNSRRVYVTEDRTSGHISGECLTHKFFNDAQSGINDVLGIKVAEIACTPLTYCVDKVTSCSKESFCSSSSLNSFLDDSASISKNVSIAACYIPANAIALIGKPTLEIMRIFKGTTYKIEPNGTTTWMTRSGANS